MNKLRHLLFIWLILAALLTSCNVADFDIKKRGEYLESGIASWYGAAYHGGTTANGETYDMNSLTAAHPSLPFNTIVHVANLRNGKSVNVRINNRGPFVPGRVIDLSRRAASEIDILTTGLTDVEIYLVREP